MYNLLAKELKLSVSPFFYILPFLTGALMLIPGWLYFFVILYFCFITVPIMFAGYNAQNDLIFSSMMPVTKKDIVKARVSVVVILEVLHIIVAMVYGFITLRLYPNQDYTFFAPTFGFWGLCFIMLAVFNIIFFTMYYKTAHKFGAATLVATIAAILFAGGAEWIGIQNSYLFHLFKGTGADNLATQLSILIMGIGIFAILTIITYYISQKRFEKVEV